MVEAVTSLLTPDTFEFFARYLLAGFVFIAARARFIAGERPNLAEKLIEAVILSVIVQAVYLLLAVLLSSIGSRVGRNYHLDPQVGLAVEAVLLPAGLGLMAGWMIRSGWQNAMLRRLAMPVEHPIQRAYDFAFDRLRQPCLVILTFQDGQRVLGYFGPNSLAASDPNHSDIFLERLYDMGPDDQWYEKTPGRSGLVSLTGLRSVEFLDSEGVADA